MHIIVLCACTFEKLFKLLGSIFDAISSQNLDEGIDFLGYIGYLCPDTVYELLVLQMFK